MAHIHIYTGADGSVPHPTVRTIKAVDLWDSLARGYDDFKAMPTHLLFLCLIYPIAGIVLAGFSFGYNLFPMLFPLAAGFALIGQVAIIEFDKPRAALMPILPYISEKLYDVGTRRNAIGSHV